MKDLHQLVHSLDSAHLKVLRYYLTGFTVSEKRDVKIEKLLDFLLRAEEPPTLAEGAKAIYKSAKDNRIEKLKSRLKAKVLDSLCLDINLNRTDIEDVDKAVLMINKRFTQFLTLYANFGYSEVAESVLNEVIISAKRYERYAILIEALGYQGSLEKFRDDQHKQVELTREMDFYRKCRKAVRKAEEAYSNFIALTSFRTQVEESVLIDQLVDSISELKISYKEVGSPVVLYYQKLMQMTLHMQNRSYQRALTTCQELLGLIKEYDSVNRMRRIGAIYDYMSECELHRGKLHSAIRHASMARSVFCPNKVNYLIACEHQFYCAFYNKEYPKAFNIITEILSRKDIAAGDFRWGKYRILLANSRFAQGLFSECLEALYDTRPCNRDKSGWNTSARILEIMALVETEKLDLADHRIESLRKHLERTEAGGWNIPRRHKHILNILMRLERNSFDFEKTIKQKTEMLAELDSKNRELGWTLLNPELIPFHEWFITRVPQVDFTKEEMKIAI